jgi:hypothetical protein
VLLTFGFGKKTRGGCDYDVSNCEPPLHVFHSKNANRT